MNTEYKQQIKIRVLQKALEAANDALLYEASRVELLNTELELQEKHLTLVNLNRKWYKFWTYLQLIILCAVAVQKVVQLVNGA